MKKHQKITVLSFMILLLLAPSLLSVQLHSVDHDPLVDLSLTIDILKVRSLEHEDPQLDFEEIIDQATDPDFYIVLFIDGQRFQSETFQNTKYLYDTPFSVTVDISDGADQIPIVIQLWDAADEGHAQDRLCDISPGIGQNDDAFDVNIIYDVRTGHWTGDDANQDDSGYGRLNGCDDGSIYQQQRDCELWFNIQQNDADQDYIPYYMETEVYGTDPLVNDALLDHDNDGIPTGWEWKYEFDPFSWDDHGSDDVDNDGLTTFYEYRTSQWFSDPFTRDLFLELDQMEAGPNHEASIFPEGAKELLYTSHDRQNVIYHLDDGSWEETGSDFITFDPVTDYQELREIYNEYFLHGDEDNWRKQVFHYGVVIYWSDRVEGMAFGANRFQISYHLLEQKVEDHGFDRDVTFASAYMHETGHTLGFWPIPGHNQYGWLLRIFLPLYKSCMSYGWIYRMVDYSDGSRPHLGPFLGDYDDWERMDLTFYLHGW